ncbi:MAG: hypothetical protein IJ696_08370 [Ruminococcus sp.]|nr:hypothetical protein [Ruminococcus sp.]
MRRTWKKAVAFTMALALASGVTPASAGTGGLLGSTVILANAEGTHDVTATLDLGEGHETLAQKLSGEGVTANGSRVTMTISAEYMEEVYGAFFNLVENSVDNSAELSYPIIDNNECFYGIGKKLLNQYSDNNELSNEFDAAATEEVGDSVTLYALWEQPVNDTYELVFESPVCGTEVTIKNFGSIATNYSEPAPSYILNGVQSSPFTGLWYSSYNVDNNQFGSLITGELTVGDKCYTRVGTGAPFGYYFADTFNATNFNTTNCEIKNFKIYNEDPRFANVVVEVPVEHSDYVRSEVTQAPTATEPGIVTYYCKCGTKTKTEEILAGIYSINAASGIENGSISFDKESTYQKDVVTVNVSPDTGYRLDRLYYAAGGQEVDIIKTSEGQYTFEMPGSDVTVYAEFDYCNTVIVDFGEGHEATAAKLTYSEGCTVNGSTVKFHLADGATKAAAKYAINELFTNAEMYGTIENGQKLMNTTALHPISYYDTSQDIENESNDIGYQQIGDAVTFYALWAEPVSELTITAPEYKCGQVLFTRTQDSTTRYEPCKVQISEGLSLLDYHLLYTNWEIENGETVLQGGRCYNIHGFIEAPWNKYIPADADISVNGGELVSFDPSFSNQFKISVPIEHNWNESDECTGCQEKRITPQMSISADSSRVNINIFVPTEDGYTALWGGTEQTLTASTLDGYKQFTVSCSAKEMANEKSLVIKHNDTVVYDSKVSVASYLNYIIGNNNYPEYHAIAKAMLRYGAAAQTYFNYNTETLANTGIEGAELSTLTDIPDNSPTAAEYNTAFALTYSDYSAMNMTFTSDTTLLIAFKPKSGATAEQVTGELTEKFANDDYLLSVDADNSGSYYIVKVQNIPIKKLGDAIFTFDEVEVKATDYLGRIANNTAKSENLRNLCKALYAYYTVC